jgi:hypothetical protein
MRWTNSSTASARRHDVHRHCRHDIFVSVLLRYLFNTSIPDSYDFGRLLLGSHLLGHCSDQLSRRPSRRSRVGGGPTRQTRSIFSLLVLLFVVTVQTAMLFDKVRSTRADHPDLRSSSADMAVLHRLGGNVSAVILIAVRTSAHFHRETRFEPIAGRGMRQAMSNAAAGSFVAVRADSASGSVGWR